ncbi:MAG: ArsA family ATPase [Mycobacteriales bacterium]
MVSPLRLHVVTGKGGTGKSTVAAALAIALASGGRKVLLAEVEGRQGIAQLFDTPPLPYEERRVAVAPGHGEVLALAIDPEEALLEYLEMFYNMRRAGRVLKRLGAVDFATTIAPGMRDVLLTGKLKEATSRQRGGRRVYDAVVVDAPPTGRITGFLNVTAEVAGLAKMGPVKNQAEGVTALLRSPATAVHLVTLLEEMPVQETVDGVAQLQKADLPVGTIVINMARSDLDIPRGLGVAKVTAGLTAANLPHDRGIVEGLRAEAAELRERLALERAERDTLATLGRPTVELPLLPDAVDLGGLYRLAEELRHQEMFI